MTNKKLMALAKNAQPSPFESCNNTINGAANDGPSTRAVLKTVLCRPMALASPSLPTNSDIMAWRAGISMALAVPKINASTNKCQI